MPSNTTTRRGALTALASLGAVVAIPRAAKPASAGTIDLADLTARYTAAYDRVRRALDASYEAEVRIIDPDPPEALYARPVEPMPMSSFVRYLDDGRGWLGDENLLKRWRKLPPDHAAWQWPGALARRDEMIAAEDAWNASYRASEDLAGFTVAEAEFKAADRVLHAFQAEIVRLRSPDLAVQRLKLQILADSIERRCPHLDDKIEFELEKRYPIETTAALSIARDLHDLPESRLLPVALPLR